MEAHCQNIQPFKFLVWKLPPLHKENRFSGEHLSVSQVSQLLTTAFLNPTLKVQNDKLSYRSLGKYFTAF